VAGSHEVIGLAAGYPYFLQEYGRELWNASETAPINMADVEEVRDRVKEQLARTFYGTRFDMDSNAEQCHLAAMASLGPGAVLDGGGGARIGHPEPVSDIPTPGQPHPKGAHLGAPAGRGRLHRAHGGGYLREHHPILGFDDG